MRNLRHSEKSGISIPADLDYVGEYEHEPLLPDMLTQLETLSHPSRTNAHRRASRLCRKCLPGIVRQPLWTGEVEGPCRSSQRMARARARRFLRSDDRGPDPLLYHPAKLRDRPPCHAGADLPGIGTVCSGVVFNSRSKLFAVNPRPRLTRKVKK